MGEWKSKAYQSPSVNLLLKSLAATDENTNAQINIMTIESILRANHLKNIIKWETTGYSVRILSQKEAESL